MRTPTLKVRCKLCDVPLLREQDWARLINYSSGGHCYVCMSCFERLRRNVEDYNNNYPEETAELYADVQEDGSIKYRWEGPEYLPVALSDEIWRSGLISFADGKVEVGPYKLFKSGQNYARGAVYMKRDLKAEREAQ